MTETERRLVSETEREALVELDEDALLELHSRVRRARTKYVKNYRRGASAVTAALTATRSDTAPSADDRPRLAQPPDDPSDCRAGFS
jgi:hypothetical protein